MKYRFRRYQPYWVCVIEDDGSPPDRPEWIVLYFDTHQFSTMCRNFRRGKCPITRKGLFRYANRWHRENNYPFS
jgi:hypothetical protein